MQQRVSDYVLSQTTRNPKRQNGLLSKETKRAKHNRHNWARLPILDGDWP